MSTAKGMYAEGGKYYTMSRPEMLPYLPTGAKRVLDVGCADGNFGAAIKRMKGCEVWGIDINPSSVEKAKSQLDRAACGCFSTTLNEYPDKGFDAIFFNDVLEHLVDPYDLLLRLKSKLTDDGVVIASIPNIRHFKTFRKLVFQRDWEYEDSGILDRTHLRFFTRNSILNMFERLGYDVISCEGIHKTKSLKPLIYHILSFGIWGLDTRFLQFAVVARPRKPL